MELKALARKPLETLTGLAREAGRSIVDHGKAVRKMTSGQLATLALAGATAITANAADVAPVKKPIIQVDPVAMGITAAQLVKIHKDSNQAAFAKREAERLEETKRIVAQVRSNYPTNYSDVEIIAAHPEAQRATLRAAFKKVPRGSK